MALSGVRDGAETVSDIITDALIEIHVSEAGETMNPEDAALGIRYFRRMLRSWAADGVRLWLNEQQTVTLSQDQATYTLGPRTLDVFDAFRRVNNDDTPIQLLTREEYNSLPNKTVGGLPYALWPDRQVTQTQVTVYPVPTTSAGTLSLGTKRQIQDVTALSETVEIPPEWSECAMYNLALRLCPAYGVQPNPITASMAGQLYAQMQGQDRGRSLRFRVVG